MKHSFTLEYWQDEGWFVGKLKEVPGIFSQGETLEQLEENIKDAYKLMIESEPKVDIENALLSEKALAKDWNKPEEDQAWSHL